MKKLLLSCLLAVVLAPAHAALSSKDSSFGAGTITFDSATGLEWLDLSVTAGQSFNSVSGLLGSTYQGFRYATAEEVLGLFSHGGVVEGKNSSALNVLNLWGTLGSLNVFGLSGRGSFALTSQEDDLGPFQNHLMYGLGYTHLPFFGNKTWVGAGPMNDSFSSSLVGSALVRVVSPVPEPATYGMMLLGLGMLGVAARRRNQG